MPEHLRKTCLNSRSLENREIAIYNEPRAEYPIGSSLKWEYFE